MAISTRLPREIDQFAALVQSDYIEGRSLLAGAAETVTIPMTADNERPKFVFFSWNADFSAKMGSSTVTAAMPTDTTDGSGSMLNPTLRKIGPNDTHISVISTAASLGVLEFFLAPSTT